MQNPKTVFTEQVSTESSIEQQFYKVNSSEKFAVLVALLKQYNPRSSLIFCNTKQQTTDLAALLKKEGFSAIALNGDMEQVDRDLAMIQFTHQSCSILVATDVAARGLDIKELPLVFNYELAFERDVHIHRIGRTGRAGSQGLAINFVTSADMNRVCLIEDTPTWEDPTKLRHSVSIPDSPPMVTLCLDLGKKDKIRAGDIVGALTKDMALPNEVIGKIDVFPMKAYVAIQKSHATQAYQSLKTGKIKGREVNVRRL